MLSFTRKLSESFVIGKDIVVKVLGKDEKGNVRLGIDAPKSVSVHRKEVYKEIHAHNTE